jgi:hypothetical protein
MVGEVACQVVPHSGRDGAAIDEVVDGAQHRLVGVIGDFAVTDRLDLVVGQSRPARDREVMRPQVVAVAPVHHAKQRHLTYPGRQRGTAEQVGVERQVSKGEVGMTHEGRQHVAGADGIGAVGGYE